ncbi:sugar transferase [Spirosoma horti]
MLTSINVKTFQQEVETDMLFSKKKHISLYKRLFDLSLASLMTISILIWLIPLVGLLIKLESRGPVFFIQLRTGRNGRPFSCFKFRTMAYDRNAVFKQAIKDDDRVTRIGKFLRKTNIDEMPQFLNVLLGNMSVVGPRPHAVEHDANYWGVLKGYHNRYATLPGITGLAQVRGSRGITDKFVKIHHRLQYDLFYIKKYTLLLDLKICWWTVTEMLKGDKNAW